MTPDITIIAGSAHETDSLARQIRATNWTSVQIGTRSVLIAQNGLQHAGPSTAASLSLSIHQDRVELSRDRFGWTPVWWIPGTPTVITTNPNNLGTLVPHVAHMPRVERWLIQPRSASGHFDFVRTVRRVPPNSTLVIGTHGARVNLKLPTKPEPIHDTIDRAPEALFVRLVPEVAALPADAVLALSGGLDSAAILACLCEIGRKPQVFTMVSRHAVTDESAWVDRLVHHFGIPKPIRFNIDAFPPFVAGMPFGSGPQSQSTEPFETAFFALASQAGPVVSGFGADQLFETTLQQRLHGAWREGQWNVWNTEWTSTSPSSFVRELRRDEAIPRDVFDSWSWEVAMRGVVRVRNSMASPLYAPFLSNAILDITRASPAHWLHLAALNKRLLRLACRGRLPDDVRRRAKTAHFGPVIEASFERARVAGPDVLDPQWRNVVPAKWRQIAIRRWMENESTH